MKKAIKWAEEFNDLDEEEQYVYLEELAPRMSRSLPRPSTPPQPPPHTPTLPQPSPNPPPTSPASRMHMQFLLGIIGTEGDEFDDEVYI